MTKQNALVYENWEEITKTQKQLEAAGESLNNLIGMLQDLFDGDITFEIKTPADITEEAITNGLRSRFPFPNASADFNYDAMGKNPRPALVFLQKNFRAWQPFNFSFENGKFTADKEQPEIEKHYYYADTDERRRVFDLMKRAAKVQKELKASGLLRGDGTPRYDDHDLNKLNSIQMPMFIQQIDAGDFRHK